MTKEGYAFQGFGRRMALLDWVKAILADAANRHSTVGTTLIILAVATASQGDLSARQIRSRASPASTFPLNIFLLAE